jgi:hypothetical protein
MLQDKRAVEGVAVVAGVVAAHQLKGAEEVQAGDVAAHHCLQAFF